MILYYYLCLPRLITNHSIDFPSKFNLEYGTSTDCKLLCLQSSLHKPNTHSLYLFKLKSITVINLGINFMGFTITTFHDIISIPTHRYTLKRHP